MTYDVMMWDKKIGELRYIDKGSSFELELICEDLTKIPYDMSLRFEEGNVLGTDEVMDWILDRIVPETQEGVLDNLKKIGIDYYDPWTIFESASGVSMMDQVWVKFKPDSTYRSTHSWRGHMRTF